jgi:hypothetical protein
MLALGFALALCALPATALEVIANGGFESGFNGWTRADALGSEGTFAIQTGTTSPVNADPVPAPPTGASAAMSDGAGPGSHMLYQDFTIAAPVLQATLKFDLFIGNRAQVFATPAPASLEFNLAAANQQVRVDVMTAAATPFSVAAGDVLQTLKQSAPGDPLVAGYATLTFDVTALVNANVGVPLRLRFAEVDNLAQFQVGVDNVSLIVADADMAVDLSGLPLTATAGVAYSGVVKCTNSAAATAAATAATCTVAGLPAGVLVGACTPLPPATVVAGTSISCPVAGTPTTPGPAVVTVTTAAANDSNTANDMATATISVAGSADMTVDLAGLPATGTVGQPYSGTVLCVNLASSTAAATAGTCTVTGLPPGVLVGACTPVPPATVAIGSAISCAIAGTPGSPGSSTVVVTTGAANDGNPGNNAASRTIAIGDGPVVPVPALSDLMLALLALALAATAVALRPRGGADRR